MAEYLRQVADHYISYPDLPQRCFIFPNRRSLTFFRKYLAEAVARSGRGPIVAPQMYTVNDFFYHVCGAEVTDRVMLLLHLYESYKALNPRAETLDEFIFWGDVLLSDFDDVDKYLVDAADLFTNVHDLKSIEDDFSHLSDRQKEAVRHFLEHFKDRGASVPAVSPDRDYKGKFLQIWDILLRLYTDFRSSLSSHGMAYEGMVYRALAERLKDDSAVDVMRECFPGVSGFAFVGLNALNECEKKVMSRMRDAGIAEFCWDYSGRWLRDPGNKSTVFMEANVRDYPQAFSPDPDGLTDPEINVLSVPSSVGQAKQIPSILQKIADSCHCGDLSRIGTETAIVLPDEGLLIPALNSIPEEISDINVTMGYPMGSSEFFCLMSDISTMQLHLRQKEGEWLFYHKQLWSVFSNSVFKAAAGEETCGRMAELKKVPSYYVSVSELMSCAADDASRELMAAVFRPVVTDARAASAELTAAMGDYQTDVISKIAGRIREDAEMAVELEFAKDYYSAVTRLRRVSLPVQPLTYVRLLNQLVGSASVPFQGEPLRGMQIMGPLETRALDFRNLVILSSNEGMFPRRSVSSSFIPPELRKAFDLPTYEFQDAVWAYYFYRMIQRAETVWMLYDSRSEGLKGGEESRYIKQLELHFGADIRRYVAKSPVSPVSGITSFPKTEEDIRRLKEKSLSASALKNYLDCQARFYLHSVKGLKAEDEVSESLDAGMIGNVFHNTMWALYSGEFFMDPAFEITRANMKENASRVMGSVSARYLSEWRKRPEDIKARIKTLVMSELHALDLEGRNIVFADVVFQYVMKVLERDLELLHKSGSQGFSFMGLELQRFWTFAGFKFNGYIDRMDSYRDGEVRVVDYKTGKVEDDDVDIYDENAERIVNELFDPDSKKRPKIALQIFLYDMFVKKECAGKITVNSIYPTAKLFVEEIREVPSNARFMALMEERLKLMLEEIADPGRDFKLTEDRSVCKFCDFKMICGR